MPRDSQQPSGLTARSIEMNTTTAATHAATRPWVAIALAAMFGVTLIFFAGLAQSETLHDAAHDVRHATGFPCH